jgi:hypothetical protein
MAAETAAQPSDFQPASEPHGMVWTRRNGVLVLQAQGWFVAQIAKQADEVFLHMRDELNKDPELNEQISAMSDGLERYLATRKELNEMAWARKMRQELDDSCYQFCQAAKYWLDAMERAQFAVKRGLNISDDATIQKLKDLSESAAREGIAVAMAVYRITDISLEMNFHTAAQRVADYSARKLTEWYAQKRVNEARTLDVSNNAALMDLVNHFKKEKQA